MCFGIRKPTTSPVLSGTQSSNRAPKVVEHLATANASLAQPPPSRDPATSRSERVGLNQETIMTSRPRSEAEVCHACNQKIDNATETAEKPTKIARKEDARKEEAAKPAPIDVDATIEDTLKQLPQPDDPPPKEKHPLFVHCNPPNAPTYRDFSIFLAGSIEMGKAIQWQKEMVKWLSPLAITVNNPRRGQWDPSATQEAKNEGFRAQVLWELDALEKADVICFFFDATTISPVTMMELGLWVGKKPGKVVVCCNKQFWRAGNIHLVCERYEVPFVESFRDLVKLIRKTLQKKAEEKGKTLEEIKPGDVTEDSKNVVPVLNDTSVQDAAEKGTKLGNIEDGYLAE